MPDDPADASVTQLIRERVRVDDELARHQQDVTILFVDVVGSTHFYDRYGDVAGLTMIQKFLDKLVPVILEHDGTPVKTIGDAVLARFPTARDGVQCALQMQLYLLAYNGARTPVEQIHIRVALNSGLALIKGDDVFGDVVNVCSRIESKAEPDDILISPSVYDRICHEADIAVRKRAEGVQLKGKTETLELYEVVWQLDQRVESAPSRPSQAQVALATLSAPEPLVPIAVGWGVRKPLRKRVVRIAVAAAAALVVIALAISFWLGRRAKRATDLNLRSPSIAVLPFVDMSPDKNQEYFSDGLAEELLNQLSKIPGLRVTGRSSSFQFKGRNEDLRTVAKKLNVSTILEGSVRKEGRRVRITTQLVLAADGLSLWSETYDRELNDILAVQEEIAGAVAASLKVQLLGAKAATPSARATNPEAYTAYLQGRYFYERRSKDDLEKATGYYEQALQIDPDFAPAWAALAWSRQLQAASGYVPLDEGYRKGRQAADRALALDPNLAEAHAAIGFAKTIYEWDWAGADAAYQRALALEPGNARILRQADVLPIALGRFDEALALDRRAVDLDPLNPSGPFSCAQSAYYGGRLEEAAAAVTKVFELAPQRQQAHSLLGLIYVAQSNPQQGLAEMQREPDLLWRLHGLAVAYHALGQKNESDKALAEFIARFRNEAAFQIAEMYAFRGEADLAFQWLERAYAQRDGGLAELKGDPLLRSLEHDPRYAALLKKLGLPL